MLLPVQPAVTPYGPTVIKQLLNEAIETGHGQEVRHNIARHFCSSTPPHLAKTTVSPAVVEVYNDSQSDRQNQLTEEAVCDGLKRSMSAASVARSTTASVASSQPLDFHTQQGDYHSCYLQCCCQGLKARGQGQGLGLANWSSRILEDKNFPRGLNKTGLQ